MSRTNFQELLDAGVHFGHLARKWNPKMAPYIFDQKNGIHIIDLHKTIGKIDEAAEEMKQLAKSGRKILFVATKKQAKELVKEKATAVNMPSITERWAGGMLTNFPTIRKAVKKMSTIDKMKEDGTFDKLAKRERLQVDRQRAKLEKNLGSASAGRPSARKAREEPRLDPRHVPPPFRPVRHRRAEGGQRRQGGQSPQHPGIRNG